MQEETITMSPEKDPNESESTSQTASLSVQRGLKNKKSKSEGVSSQEEGTTTTASSTITAPITKSEGSVEDMSGRERLKRHRVEVAGRVWVPEMWGQENLLKDWIDCTACDFSVANSSIMSARASMMEQGRRILRENNNPTRIRLENSC